MQQLQGFEKGRDGVEPGNAEALQEGVGGGIGAGKGGGVGECRGTRLGGAADLNRDDRLAQRARLGGQGLERPQGIEALDVQAERSEEHTSELQSLMRISYAVF